MRCLSGVVRAEVAFAAVKAGLARRHAERLLVLELDADRLIGAGVGRDPTRADGAVPAARGSVAEAALTTLGARAALVADLCRAGRGPEQRQQREEESETNESGRR